MIKKCLFYITFITVLSIFLSGCINVDTIINETHTNTETNLDEYKELDSTPVPSYDNEIMYIRNHLLNDIEQELYDSVYTSIINNQSIVTFNNSEYVFSSITELENTISNAIYSVFYDNPDIFWYDNAFKYSYKDSLKASDLEITLNKIFDDNTINQMQSNIDNATNKILSNISNMDEYEKSKYVYTYIAQNTVYKKSDNLNNIYGVLVDGTAVCEGYAKTYCYIMKKCGIECAVVTGNSNNEEHAWNIVKINNNYYYVDCTWGDPIIDLGSAEKEKLYVDYSYLHVTTEDISKSHFRDKLFENIPTLNSKEDNYYIRDGLYFDSFENNNFSTKLYNKIADINNIKGNNVEIKFGNVNDMNKAIEFIDKNLFNLVSDLNNEINQYSISSSKTGTIKLVLSYR